MKINPPTTIYLMEVGRGFAVAISSTEKAAPSHRIELWKEGEDKPFCTVATMADAVSAKATGRIVAHAIQAVFFRMDEDEASGSGAGGT